MSTKCMSACLLVVRLMSSELRSTGIKLWLCLVAIENSSSYALPAHHFLMKSFAQNLGNTPFNVYVPEAWPCIREPVAVQSEGSYGVKQPGR